MGKTAERRGHAPSRSARCQAAEQLERNPSLEREALGHRYLVLDQSMIMAALDNALQGGAIQRRFASDSVGAAVHPYLAMEQFSIP